MELTVHRHRAMGRDDFVRPDGVREVWWKCQCGLEEKRLFEAGECVGVRYRYAGRWADAADWLALTFPLRACDECGGMGCEACALLGVVEEDGLKITPPPPAPTRRRTIGT